ncbi:MULTISPECIES: photosystem II reaction center protein PsbZ [Planktothricoides]|uniref:Photosystem II reaction center protein Z n=2 Tax=Planktothricoides raciborskii TaxID=132608 RepID=A0AAU8JIJ2_9CYAN|nr:MULTISPECIES: photosystem II reaction center protein PsbZ [Planktothricoides]KOR34080.1 photosystem II reaction center protein Z [Planktothricoides sp. SR001]MBD2547397.1 photosystem II reaction center protein PsbZ [Planktothricoides raciborskii FACHB-1370]MBD2584558.1 photosystem II reaction center protein PsbZ [Planktothricoides raciborskii FACHB-1261]
MSVIFQFALLALVLVSFVMVIGVPVAYASPQNWDQSKPLLYIGSGIWAILVIVVGVLNYLVA